MTLLDSLLDAIVRLDGDALVMHVGEKPYVVTTSSAMNAYRGPLAWGQVELSSRILTPDAVLGMVTQILPPDQRHALEDVGAIEHEIASPAGVRDRFTVVAARGGDDIWLELRRHPVAEPAVEAPQVMADVADAQTTATAASAEAAATAVGLQEPPPPPETAAPVSTEAVGPPEPPAIEPEPVEHARVPVIDEVGGHAPEHIEHIVIPVTSGVDSIPEAGLDESVVLFEDEAVVIDEVVVIEDIGAVGDAEFEVERDGAEFEVERAVGAEFEVERAVGAEFEVERAVGAEFEVERAVGVEFEEERAVGAEFEEERTETAEFELVEPEPQHAPTEADVDAMLAATASALLSANIEPEPSRPEPPVIEDAYAAAPEFLEVVIEEEEIPLSEPVGLEESLDLVAALEEIPPASEVEVDVEIAASAEGAPDDAVIITVPDDRLEPEVHPEPEPEPQPALEPEPVRAVEPEVAPAFAATPIEQVSPERTVEHPATSLSGAQPTDIQPRIAASVQESSPAARVVVPIGERAGRPEKPGAGARVDDQILLQILEQAARRGATTVYVVAQSRPMVRVEGEISPLENIPALSAGDIERLVATLSPGRSSNALAEGQEWISEVPQVGRVRCVTFKDHRGPGLIFRISSTLTVSADHLNLAPAIRELSMQSDGLVIVTGARGSGKSTLLNSFVDLINSTRSDHMIMIESEIAFVHESRKSFVSQREAPEDHSVRAAAVSAALREDPDVLVIEDVHSSDVARAALEGAASGRLVFISMTAPSSGGAIDGLIDMLPAESRPQARAGLATTLRGVVGQVLLRRSAGGRTTARELLLNSPAVSAMIKEGRSAELVREQQNGQRFGMIPLAESLSALVRSGAVHPAEAYRRAPDRAALLAVLAREGVDTSFAERLA